MLTVPGKKRIQRVDGDWGLLKKSPYRFGRSEGGFRQLSQALDQLLKRNPFYSSDHPYAPGLSIAVPRSAAEIRRPQSAMCGRTLRLLGSVYTHSRFAHPEKSLRESTSAGAISESHSHCATVFSNSALSLTLLPLETFSLRAQSLKPAFLRVTVWSPSGN